MIFASFLLSAFFYHFHPPFPPTLCIYAHACLCNAQAFIPFGVSRQKAAFFDCVLSCSSQDFHYTYGTAKCLSLLCRCHALVAVTPHLGVGLRRPRSTTRKGKIASPSPVRTGDTERLCPVLVERHGEHVGGHLTKSLQ